MKKEIMQEFADFEDWFRDQVNIDGANVKDPKEYLLSKLESYKQIKE